MGISLDVPRDVAEAAARAHSEDKGHGSSAAASPFEVPRWVSITLEDGDTVKFLFSYVNPDAASPESFKGRGDGRSTVELGRISGRILTLRLERATECLRDPQLQAIEPEALDDYIDALGLSHWEKESARQNAAIVNQLIVTLPAELRKQVLELLDRERTPARGP